MDSATRQENLVEDPRSYSFGPFRLETDRGVLSRDGVSLNLRPKAFDVLHYLVRHPQRLVSREELLRAAWPGVVVTDDSLTQCLIEIRRALDDREKRIVRTVPRRGYLLDLPVQVGTAGRPAVAGQGGAPVARPPSREPAYDADPRAWESYLRGKYFLDRRMQGDLLRAHRYLEQALAIDPDLVPAWVALAGNYIVRRSEAGVAIEDRLPAEEALPLARQALEKALALDPDHPEALLRMSGLTLREGDRERGLDQIELAMRNGRNHALVQAMLAGLAFASGQVEAAITLQRRAAKLDPVSTVIQTNLGFHLYAAGRLDEAEEAFDRARESNPENVASELDMRVWIAIHRGDLAGAAAAARLLPEGIARDQAQAMLATHTGDVEGAEAALQRLQRSEQPGAPAAVAYVHAFRGERDEAFRWLRRAADSAPPGEEWWETGVRLTELSTSPFLQPLQGDPRWPTWLAETRGRWQGEEVQRVSGMLQRYLAVLATE